MIRSILSLLVAGGLVLSTTAAAYAVTVNTNWGTSTVVSSSASSNSGGNSQFGGGFQYMSTGNAWATSNVLSVANQNAVGRSFSSTFQTNGGTTTVVGSAAGSNTGTNSQVSFGPSVKVLRTGNVGGSSSVASWANINLKGVTVTP